MISKNESELDRSLGELFFKWFDYNAEEYLEAGCLDSQILVKDFLRDIEQNLNDINVSKMIKELKNDKTR